MHDLLLDYPAHFTAYSKGEEEIFDDERLPVVITMQWVSQVHRSENTVKYKNARSSNISPLEAYSSRYA